MGDFHEPYGAITGEFDKQVFFLDFYDLSINLQDLERCETLENFCYNLEKPLQDRCNLPDCEGG